MNESPSHSQLALERIRLVLAGSRGLLILAMLGLISGTLVGAVVIIFRFVIETSQTTFLLSADPENYEAMGWQSRIVLSTIGGLILGILFYVVSRPPPRVGVIHTLERLAYHEGHLPFKNALLQFVGGAISIISGHSVGREGPSIHLGAASASLLVPKQGIFNPLILL